MIEVIEKISLINIDYGPSVQFLMDCFGSDKINPSDPEYSQQRDSIKFSTLKSSGKLTRYNIPLTLSWTSSLKLVLYIFSFLLKIPTQIMVTSMIKTEKAIAWKCKLANILRRMHIVLFNAVLADIIFSGCIKLFHVRLAQVQALGFANYALIVVAQFIALYDVNTFF